MPTTRDKKLKILTQLSEGSTPITPYIGIYSTHSKRKGLSSCTKRKKASFEDDLDYLMEKNRELHKRLA